MGWPIFVKGAHQTNKHKKALSMQYGVSRFYLEEPCGWCGQILVGRNTVWDFGWRDEKSWTAGCNGCKTIECYLPCSRYCENWGRQMDCYWSKWCSGKRICRSFSHIHVAKDYRNWEERLKEFNDDIK